MLLVSLYMVAPSVVICACLYGTLAYRATAPAPAPNEHYVLAMQLKATMESQSAQCFERISVESNGKSTASICCEKSY